MEKGLMDLAQVRTTEIQEPGNHGDSSRDFAGSSSGLHDAPRSFLAVEAPLPSNVPHTQETHHTPPAPPTWGPPNPPMLIDDVSLESPPPPPLQRKLTYADSRSVSDTPHAFRPPGGGKVIGHVLDKNGSILCSDLECITKRLRFSRVADLRRHCGVRHSLKPEYFCSYEGCSRSNKTRNFGKQGKSFGSRRDKREEHERMVHQKGVPSRGPLT